VWLEFAERAAHPRSVRTLHEQREGADSGQPVVAAAVVQAEQHAVGAETFDEPRGCGFDGGRQCYRQHLGGLWPNDGDGQWIGSVIVAIGAHQPRQAARLDYGGAGAGSVHRAGVGFAATVFGFPDRYGLC